MKRVISILLIFSIFSLYPLMVNAEEGVSLFSDPDDKESEEQVPSNNETMYSEEYIMGMNDGEKNVTPNKLFFFSGFCLQIIGVIIPFVLTYEPPLKLLQNKSIAYSMGLKERYNAKMRSENGKMAIIGLVSYYGMFLLIYFLMILSAFIS